MDSSSLSSIMKGVGGCVVGYEITPFLHRPSLQQVVFGGEKGEDLGVFILARTRVSRRLRGRR